MVNGTMSEDAHRQEPELEAGDGWVDLSQQLEEGPEACTLCFRGYHDREVAQARQDCRDSLQDGTARARHKLVMCPCTAQRLPPGAAGGAGPAEVI
jgi:hypothetical protein